MKYLLLTASALALAGCLGTVPSGKYCYDPLSNDCEWDRAGPAGTHSSVGSDTPPAPPETDPDPDDPDPDDPSDPSDPDDPDDPQDPDDPDDPGLGNPGNNKDVGRAGENPGKGGHTDDGTGDRGKGGDNPGQGPAD